MFRTRHSSSLIAFALLAGLSAGGVSPFARFNKPDGEGEGGGGGDGGGGGGAPPKTYTQDEYDQLHRETMSRKARIGELENKLKDLEGRSLTPDEIAEFRKLKAEQAAAEEDKKKKAGEFEGIIRDKDEKHKAALAAEKQRADEALRALNTERIDNVLATHIPKSTRVAVEDVAPILRPFLQVEDGKVIVVKDGEKNPIDPETGKPHTPASFIKSEIGKRDWLADAPPSGSGSGSQRGRGGGAKVWTREEVRRLTPDEYKKHKAEIEGQMEGSEAAA